MSCAALRKKEKKVAVIDGCTVQCSACLCASFLPTSSPIVHVKVVLLNLSTMRRTETLEDGNREATQHPQDALREFESSRCLLSIP